jgi:hypothetical protein
MYAMARVSIFDDDPVKRRPPIFLWTHAPHAGRMAALKKCEIETM